MENSDFRNVFFGTFKGFIPTFCMLAALMVFIIFWCFIIAYPFVGSEINVVFKTVILLPVILALFGFIIKFYTTKPIRAIEISSEKGMKIYKIKTTVFHSWGDINKVLACPENPTSFILFLRKRRIGIAYTGLNKEDNIEVVRLINLYLKKSDEIIEEKQKETFDNDDSKSKELMR